MGKDEEPPKGPKADPEKLSTWQLFWDFFWDRPNAVLTLFLGCFLALVGMYLAMRFVVRDRLPDALAASCFVAGGVACWFVSDRLMSEPEETAKPGDGGGPEAKK